uniref:DNA polymerase III subunit gamma/tau n=1 Tax=Panagrellus redivivus TaxID=6233 RepID=A0A7E4WE54_PANRE
SAISRSLINDALELQASGYVIPPENIQQSTSYYAANLSDAQRIQRELSNLSLGDQQRVSTTLDYINGQVTEEGFAESIALIDNVFGPTVALNPANRTNVSESISQIASTSTAAEATDRSVTPSPVSLPSISTPPAATVPASKPNDTPKADEKPSEPPATSAGNDSFKKAFQQWRRIYDDTPEHIVAEVLTPALTKSSLANYKPVIHAGARPETDPLEELERQQANPPAPQEDSLYISDDDEESYAEDGYDEEENIDAYDTEDAEDYDYEDPDDDVY